MAEALTLDLAEAKETAAAAQRAAAELRVQVRLCVASLTDGEGLWAARIHRTRQRSCRSAAVPQPRSRVRLALRRRCDRRFADKTYRGRWGRLGGSTGKRPLVRRSEDRLLGMFMLRRREC